MLPPEQAAPLQQTSYFTERQTDDVVEVAVKAFDKRGGMALSAVGSGFIEWPGRGDIVADFSWTQGAEVHGGLVRKHYLPTIAGA